MAATTPNMGLVVWNQTNDFFDHTTLAANLTAIDSHDHSQGKGKQVGNAGLQSGCITLDKIAPSLYPSFVPTGAIFPYGGSTAPSGYLLCDGSQYSQVSFGALYGVIGGVYGSAASGSFVVPNLQQRFPLGKATSGTGSTLGSSGGTIDHVHTVPGLSVPSIPIPSLVVTGSADPHSHPLSANGGAQMITPLFSSDVGGDYFATNWGGSAGPSFQLQRSGLLRIFPGNGSHAQTTANAQQQGIALYGNTDNTEPSIHGSTSSTTVSTTTNGANTGAANPPFLVVNYIIKY